jgi:hypothetical protein
VNPKGLHYIFLENFRKKKIKEKIEDLISLLSKAQVTERST